jgi:hypothetical protein
VGFLSLTPRRPTQTTVFVLAERGMAGRDPLEKHLPTHDL